MNVNVARAALSGSLLLLLLASVAHSQNAPPPVTVAKPIVRDVVDDDEFIGRFAPVEQVTVRSRIGGYLQEIHFADGAIVKQGDLLFVIDQRPYMTAFNEASSALEVAKSTLTYADAQFKRAQTLSQNGSQSISILDDRRREWISAQANVRGAQAALDRASLDLDYTKIAAPISGRVDRHLISPGNLVQADSSVLTTIVTLDPIDFYFDVDERRLLNFQETAKKRGVDLQASGGDVNVSVRIGNNSNREFKGKLNFAENHVDDESGTMRIRARFPNSDLTLQPGLFGRISVEASNTYSAVLIPDEAIGTNQNERIVYTVDGDGTIKTKAVRTGPRLYGYRVIRAGLDGSETIVVNGLMRVRPGGKVTPKMTELPQSAPTVEAAQ